MLDEVKTAGLIAGTDFAGVIAKLGPDVPASVNRAVGDRVAGFILVGGTLVSQYPTSLLFPYTP